MDATQIQSADIRSQQQQRELNWNGSSATSLTLTNTYTGAYVNGISTNNIFSIALKIFPMNN